jgi:mRNA-degrading endonuclease RelE of RelBE toxin-antitoxin system
MTFLLSSTFTDSLAKLTAEEQKVAKTTAFDLQINPANPGHQFHKLDRARDKAFWSVRVSSDLRIIVHRTDQSLMLCYVDHHDKAYAWAERRKLEVHPQTGAAQLVELRETVHEIVVPKYIETEVQKPALFHRCTDLDLMSWGVPQDWLPDVRTATEDTLLQITDHLPSEAAEALLEVAVGGWPVPKQAGKPHADPFDHPDAQRRFQVLANSEDLQRALDAPWEKWITFLHPDQKDLVGSAQAGPFRVSGSSGTGKTIVALHRAVYLARANPEARVLLATFSESLAHALKDKLNRLISGEPKLAERVSVHSMLSFGVRLLETSHPDLKLIDDEALAAIVAKSSGALTGHTYSVPFLLSEWTDVVEAWGLESWEDYKNVTRLGRKTRLPEAQRKVLWSIFETVKTSLAASRQVTESGLFNALSREIAQRKHPPFEFVVIDEAQDVSLPQLRFLAAFGAKEPNRLFFSGDTAQRIFRTPFSWKAAGIDLRGRCRTLKVNYRTSHQIRRQADRLLGKSVSDVDGNVDDRFTTVSVFNGPDPRIEECANRDQERALVVAWLRDLLDQGCKPHELAVIVRSSEEFSRAHEVAVDLGLPFVVLDDHVSPVQGKLSVVTMHLAKGLEFRGVAVIACDEGVIPSDERIDSAAEASDLEEIYNTERNLLYVACTRARDFLLVTSGGAGSEFLGDLSCAK